MKEKERNILYGEHVLSPSQKRPYVLWMNVYLFAVHRKTVLHSVSKESLGKVCVLHHRLHNFYVVLHLRFKDTQRPKLFVKTQIVPRSNVA